MKNVPDGWKTEFRADEEVPDSWSIMVKVASGSQDMTVPTVPDGGQDKTDTAGKRYILGALTSGGGMTSTASITIERTAINKVVMKNGDCGPYGQKNKAKQMK